MKPERFNFHSDIDLLVQELKEDYLKIHGELLSITEFDFDLIPIEKAKDYILQSAKERSIEL